MTAPDGFVYVADFLSPPEHDELLRFVAGLEYYHDTFRGQRLKRGFAQFGFTYVTSGRRLRPAAPLPPELAALLVRATPFCPDALPFNQCIVTRYPAGAGIGWHVDAPGFGEVIVGVSLGGVGRFQFRRLGEEAVAYELDLAAGSLYRMQGPARWDYQHQVTPGGAVRFSLTFRHVPEPE